MRLFGSNQFEDTNDEQQLFTYSSPGFIRAHKLIMNGEVPDENCFNDPPELVYEEDQTETYSFKDFWDEEVLFGIRNKLYR